MNLDKDGYILITGAGSGLGKSLAKQFSKNKFSLVLVGRTKLKLEATANECNNEKILTIEADVSKYDEIENCFKHANQWGGYPLMVISCAGEGVFGQVGGFTMDHIDRVFSGSLIGTILASQRAFIEMKARGGTIVNVMSTAATTPRTNESIYCAAKWGAKGFTESLRLEAKGTKVKVIGVYPGGIQTPFWSEKCGMQPDTTGFMKPDELAETIVETLLNKQSLYVADIVINRV